MSTSAWATHALQAFDNVVAAQAHLRPRAGQREMAAQAIYLGLGNDQQLYTCCIYLHDII